MYSHLSRSSGLACGVLLAIAAPAAEAVQSPYHGTPFQIPALVEAERYDFGGPGVAHHDTTPGNVFGAFRADDVDVGSFPNGGLHIGYLANGEWVEYTVDVPITGFYEIRLRVASAYAAPKTFHMELDGQNVTGTQTIPYTGNWQTYVIKTIPNVLLTAGSNKVLRISFDTGAWNLDKFDVRGQVPWSQSAADLPGRVQAEHFDLGGEGIAYHDTTFGNVFNHYRFEDVDVGAVPGGGRMVGYVQSGEWIELTVDVNEPRSYELLMRVASADTRTVRYHVELDGQDLTGAQTVPHTGGWNSYVTQNVPVGTLSAGSNKVLKVSFDLNAFNLDWIELRAAACTAPTITSHPVNRTVPVGTGVTLTSAASGTAPLSYQWYRNGAAVSGGTGSSLPLGAIQAEDTGLYFVRITNGCGSSDSNQAEVLLTCDPGELSDTLTNVIQGEHRVCPWQNQYLSGWPNSMGGGSYNKPVLAAAIAAVADPGLPGPDGPGSTVRDWWIRYLEGELGQRGSVWAFGGREPFSHVYHHNNLAAVMAVNYEARRRGWTGVRGLARQWLRANFALMAAAATDKPLTFHDRSTMTDWNDGYVGPWVATAGMRTWWASWGFSSRLILFARAVGFSVNDFGEFPYQTTLRGLLEGLDNGWNVATEGDVYGLTTSEKTALAGIKGSNQLPAGFSGWIAGVHAIVPYHIVAWPGVRVSLMEGNVNGNTTPTYGVAYFTSAVEAGGREAHFLYPWDRNFHRSCIRGGSATIDLAQGVIEATSGPPPTCDPPGTPGGTPCNVCTGNPYATPPVPPRHPEETSRVDELPGTSPGYHIVL